MVPETPPTAEGELAQTPFAHLAVFAVDRRLTGELFLLDPTGVEHAIRFQAGCPVKLRVSDEFARLGGLLVDGGVVSADVVEGAAAMKGGLLGDLLVLSGYLESAALDSVIEEQFRVRMQRCFSLPASTSYKYFEGSSELRDWGGDPMSLDPLELVWAGLREHGACSTLLEPTLELLGDTPLKLHPRAPLDRLGLDEQGQLVIEVLDLEPAPMAELLTIEGVDPEFTRNLLYLLTITRQLDLGKPLLPVGVGKESVAKVRLQSKAHRLGVALDAPVPEGDRVNRVVSVRGRALIPRDDGAPPSSPGDSGLRPAVDAAPASAGAASSPGAAPDPSLVGAEATPLSEVVSPAAAAEPILDEPSGGEESSRRLIADAVRGLTHAALLKLAREKMDERDPSTAAEICLLGRRRLEEEGNAQGPEWADLVVLHAWSRSLEPQPDLKALTIELDELIGQKDADPVARLVRARIRKKLGDDAGAQRDWERVLELDPGNAEAAADLRSKTVPPKATAQPGLLKRLFRR